jgi:hypothetical protein
MPGSRDEGRVGPGRAGPHASEREGGASAVVRCGRKRANSPAESTESALGGEITARWVTSLTEGSHATVAGKRGIGRVYDRAVPPVGARRLGKWAARWVSGDGPKCVVAAQQQVFLFFHFIFYFFSSFSNPI